MVFFWIYMYFQLLLMIWSQSFSHTRTCWILMKDLSHVSVMWCLHRQTTLAVYLMSLVGMVIYAFTLNLGHLWVVFITAGTLGYEKIFTVVHAVHGQMKFATKKYIYFLLFKKKCEKSKSFAQNLFVCVLLTQVLHDGLSSPRFWVCRRIDLPRVWGDVFRTSELLRTGMCVIFIKKITKKKASQINIHMDYTRKSKLKG